MGLYPKKNFCHQTEGLISAGKVITGGALTWGLTVLLRAMRYRASIEPQFINNNYSNILILIDFYQCYSVTFISVFRYHVKQRKSQPLRKFGFPVFICVDFDDFTFPFTPKFLFRLRGGGVLSAVQTP